MDYLSAFSPRFPATIKNRKGQTLVEYALLLLLVAILVIIMVRGVGLQSNSAYSTVNSTLTGS